MNVDMTNHYLELHLLCLVETCGLDLKCESACICSFQSSLKSLMVRAIVLCFFGLADKEAADRFLLSSFVTFILTFQKLFVLCRLTVLVT